MWVGPAYLFQQGPNTRIGTAGWAGTMRVRFLAQGMQPLKHSLIMQLGRLVQCE